eukprot:6190854-Amphidinium_carterae.1
MMRLQFDDNSIQSYGAEAITEKKILVRTRTGPQKQDYMMAHSCHMFHPQESPLSGRPSSQRAPDDSHCKDDSLRSTSLGEPHARCLEPLGLTPKFEKCYIVLQDRSVGSR